MYFLVRLKNLTWVIESSEYGDCTTLSFLHNWHELKKFSLLKLINFQNDQPVTHDIMKAPLKECTDNLWDKANQQYRAHIPIYNTNSVKEYQENK